MSFFTEEDFDRVDRGARRVHRAVYDPESILLDNQRVWDAHPERALEDILNAIVTGGFDDDCIRRHVGNWEGQVMAIRKGYVRYADGSWTITSEGLEALAKAHKDLPVTLTIWDDWHGRGDWALIQEVTRKGRHFLRLCERAMKYGSPYGFSKPLWRREDVIQLRNYLDKWLERTK